MNLRLPGVRAQGGFSTGRTSTDHCDIAAQLPEILGTRSRQTSVMWTRNS